VVPSHGTWAGEESGPPRVGVARACLPHGMQAIVPRTARLGPTPGRTDRADHPTTVTSGDASGRGSRPATRTAARSRRFARPGVGQRRSTEQSSNVRADSIRDRPLDVAVSVTTRVGASAARVAQPSLDESMEWVFVCGDARSVRRVRVERQRRASVANAVVYIAL
jgi:hypothetical protein